MNSRLDRLFDDYDRGHLSRRGLMAALIPLIAAEPAKAADTLTVKTLNHVSLNVTDIDKSREFYQGLFGAPIVSKQSNGINIAMGAASFLGLYKMGPTPPAIHHVCFGLEQTVETAGALLERHNVKPQIRDRDGVNGVKELYFRDPDNIMIQLQEQTYRG
jgi:catechol 2,3-dioxygenase-like lactoylglutathione lyase family enzyme